MDGSIRLTAKERKTLLRVYRVGRSAKVSRHAHVLLLLDGGYSYRSIHELLFASFDLIAAAVRAFQEGGVAAVSGAKRDDELTIPIWLVQVSRWLTEKQPEDFGYLRRRWTCDMLREVLWWTTGKKVSCEKVRRGLRKLQFVWRRPRPIVGPKDPDYTSKLRKIQHLLSRLPAHETAVFQDEVDVHLNPKIGSCWMRRGEQAEVVTPGNNEKRHLAGSLAWRTGTLIVSDPGTRRNAQLFVRHLDDLRRRLRTYRTIHVICDNAKFHDCREVRDYLKRWGHRLVLHFLPKYAPETNPIERIWWRLHESVTRNHRCEDIQQLLDDVFEWVKTNKRFEFSSKPYIGMAA
jgi:putative transposase